MGYTTNRQDKGDEMVTKQELIDEMGCTDVVHCDLSSGDSFDVWTADYWIGGSEGRFMCDFIGNVEYNTIESCVNALFAYLDKKKLQIAEID
jgi:hypothetical protein